MTRQRTLISFCLLTAGLFLLCGFVHAEEIMPSPIPKPKGNLKKVPPVTGATTIGKVGRPYKPSVPTRPTVGRPVTFAPTKVGFTVRPPKPGELRRVKIDAPKLIEEAVTKATPTAPANLAENGLIHPEWLSDVVGVPNPFFAEPQKFVTTFGNSAPVQAARGNKAKVVGENGIVMGRVHSNIEGVIVRTAEGEELLLDEENFATRYEPAPELGEGWFKPREMVFVQAKLDMRIKDIHSIHKSQLLRKGDYLLLDKNDPTRVYFVGGEYMGGLYKPVEGVEQALYSH